jgi:hypothetical protein
VESREHPPPCPRGKRLNLPKYFQLEGGVELKNVLLLWYDITQPLVVAARIDTKNGHIYIINKVIELSKITEASHLCQQIQSEYKVIIMIIRQIMAQT